MPSNAITSTGLTIQTLAEILTEIQDGTSDYPGLKAIYGTDINLDPNSPDGQLLNIIAQAKVDMLELINQVFSSFDPDQAIGVNLDRRCAINGIHRAGGTYTQQPVEVTIDRAVTLPGLDTNPTSPFTIQDTAGNPYQLVSTTALVAPGTHTLIFQAKEVGAVSSGLNTITEIITVTLGVVAVNNISAATTVGVAQESDAALRVRRARSVSIPSKGYLDGLIGALLDLNGVTQVEVFENMTATTDSRGIPGHSIWVIVAGGNVNDIANVIYIKRSLGCGMRGETTATITQSDGLTITIAFDRPIIQDLWVKFDVEAITGVIDIEYLHQQIMSRMSYRIDQVADTATIVALVKSIYPNASVSQEGVSTDGINYFPLVVTNTVQHQFAIHQLDINGVIS